MSEYDIAVQVGLFIMFVLKIATVAMIVTTVVSMYEALSKYLNERKNKNQLEIVAKRKDETKVKK